MERVYENLRRTGKDLSTEDALRLESRPLVDICAVFEDYGSLLNGSQKQRTSNAPGFQKFKPGISSGSKKPGPAARLPDRTGKNASGIVDKSESNHHTAVEIDELDLISPQTNSAHDPSTFQQPLLRSQKAGTQTLDVEGSSNETGDVGYTDQNGTFHPYHDRFRPSKFDFIHKLKFSKNKILTPSSSLSSLHPAVLPPMDNVPRESFSGPGNVVKQPPSESCLLTSVPPPGLKIGPPKARPKRVLKAQADPVKDQSLKRGDSSATAAPPKHCVKPLGHLQSRQRSRSRSRSKSCSRTSSQRLVFEDTVRKPAAFPLSPPNSPDPPKLKVNAFPTISPLRDSNSRAEGGSRQLKRQLSSSRQADPFPMPSFKGREEAGELRGRVLVKKVKDKGKTKENEETSLFTEPEEEDDGEDVTVVVSKDKGKGDDHYTFVEKEREKDQRRKVKRFPMSTRVLQSIDSSPPGTSSRRGKRLSQGSGDERMTKKSKKELDVLLQSPTRGFEEEGDSVLISPHVDPRNLCPYCDTPLPKKPSSVLLDILAATRQKAKSDPRPSNPLGLKAPMVVFVTVCQRHRFESEILPEAERKGWPKSIEWHKLAERVMKMKNMLQALIDDAGDVGVLITDGDVDDWEVPYDCTKRKAKCELQGPKAKSIFWNEVMKEVKEKGSRVVAGVRGQFANFEKAQPGYYGEQGSVIIHQTLYDMFPPSSIDPNLIAPLTSNEFMQKILVPEVALHLIMEDKSFKGEDGKLQALTILRESSAYGVFMFPEDGGEWSGSKKKRTEDQLGVGDMIVLQRAMRRRKELEEEEKAKQEEEERIMLITERRKKGREGRVKGEEVRGVKPRPRPVGKGSSGLSSQNENSRSHRSPSRSIYGDTDPASGIETAIEISDSDSDSGYRPTSRDKRRSPSASERRKPFSTRSASRGLAGLNLSSDSESSSGFIVNAGRLTRSKSRSFARPRSPEDYPFRMEIDRDEDGVAIEILDAAKTPVPIRRKMEMKNDDDTPKILAPLLRARQRHTGTSLASRQNSVSSDPPLPTLSGSNSQAKRGLLKQDSFEWLLNDSSP